MNTQSRPEKQALETERLEILQQLEEWLDAPMLALSFAWLALLIVELIGSLTPLLEATGTAIWILFILHFTVEFTLAPHKLAYLRRNWLTAISLVVPGLRSLRIFRTLRVLHLARAAGGVRLLRVVSALNRGMRSLRAAMRRHGFSYVLALTVTVTLVGAAGMYAFESNTADERGLNDYGTALWWTAMLMTTMGSEYWPKTPEGRVLCLILALYAFAVFGYVTATLATFFVGRDAEDEEAEIAGAKSIAALHEEIAALRAEIQALSRQHRT